MNKQASLSAAIALLLGTGQSARAQIAGWPGTARR
jgi:hypothetical protein